MYYNSRPIAPLAARRDMMMTSSRDSWRLSWRRCPVPLTHGRTYRILLYIRIVQS
jgi:hypothetical protein